MKINECAVMKMCVERGALEGLIRSYNKGELDEHSAAQEITECVMEEILMCFKFNSGDENGNSCEI